VGLVVEYGGRSIPAGLREVWRQQFELRRKAARQCDEAAGVPLESWAGLSGQRGGGEGKGLAWRGWVLEVGKKVGAGAQRKKRAT
jgi:hypothetical protein